MIIEVLGELVFAYDDICTAGMEPMVIATAVTGHFAVLKRGPECLTALACFHLGYSCL
jgi:hypothetical protein